MKIVLAIQYFRERFSTLFYVTNLSFVQREMFSHRLKLFSIRLKMMKEGLFSEIAGLFTEFFIENTAKMGEIIKSHIKTNLCNVQI